MKQNKVLSSILSNWIPKILSLLLAMFIVLSVRIFNINDRVVILPLEVALPEGLEPASLVPDTVEVAITGPDSIIYLVNPDEIKAYADFSLIEEPGIARVPVMLEYDHDIFTSDGLDISASPSTVRILFENPV